MGLPEKGDDAAGSGSGEPSMTIEKCVALRGLPEKSDSAFFLSSLFYGVT